VEVAEMRKLLEARAAFLASQRATTQGIAGVREIHAQLIEAGRAASPARLMRLNQQFHFGVYRLSESELLLETITQLWLRVGPHLAHLMDQRLERPGRGGALNYFTEHEALLKALVSHDAQGAVAAIVADIEGGTALFLESVRTSESADAALSLVTGSGPAPRSTRRS
jgi:DNA-binding GntR family transcriptional regulator